MGLPVALGAKSSVSSHPIETYVHHVVQANHPNILNHQDNHHDEQSPPPNKMEPLMVDPHNPHQLPTPLVAYAVTRDATSSRQNGIEWQALVSLYYFQEAVASSASSSINGDHTNKVTAEFHVQIAPAGEPLSHDYPETTFKVPLPLPQKNPSTENNSDSGDATTTTPNSPLLFPDPSVPFTAHFSNDRKSLICIIPLPQTKRRFSTTTFPTPHNNHSWTTLTVLFPLQRPSLTAPPPKLPPLPTYLNHHNNSKTNTTIAKAASLGSRADGTAALTHYQDTMATGPGKLFEAASPQILVDTPPLSQLSCVCNVAFVPHDPKKSFVLVGDAEGQVRAVTSHPLSVSKPIPLLTRSSSKEQIETNGSQNSVDKQDNGASSIVIQSMQSVTEGFMDGCYRGNLAIVNDEGHVTLWRWRVAQEPESGPLGDFFQSHEIPLVIGGQVGALWILSVARREWSIPEPVTTCQWVTPWNLACVQKANDARNKQVTVTIWGWAYGHAVSRSTLKVRMEDLLESASSTFRLPGTVGRDNGCTVVQTKMEYDPLTECLLISSSFLQKDSNSLSGKLVPTLPFVMVWNWRANVRGFTLHLSEKDSLGRSSPHCRVLSHLLLVRDSHGRRRLVHLLACPSAHKCSVQKEIYELGTLSPSSQHFVVQKPIQPEAALLLTSESICYPHASQLTVTGDYQIEWKDMMIPPDFLLCDNTPTLACIGKRGLSMAVAGKHFGFSTLEEHPKSRKRARRWHRFANDQSEQSFRVVSMAWWEGRRAKEDYMAEDLLVAVIEVHQEDSAKPSCYLSCWSPRRLDLNHQLFMPVNKKVMSPFSPADDSNWGIRLTDDIHSISLNILEEPSEYSTPSPSFRKALILLSSGSQNKEFRMFQTQLVRRTQSAALTYSEKQPCAALIRCVGKYELGSPADLFLAGGSYAFDLLAARRGTLHDDTSEYIATIGVIRHSVTGFDAIAVSASTICAIGSIPLSESVHSPTEVATYWLSDIAEKLSTFVWTLQLSDGNLICWSVPFAGSIPQHKMIVQRFNDTGSVLTSHLGSHKLVHKNSLLLGSYCATGSSETWMQVSSSTTKQELPLGPLPGSAFGCVLASGQACRKLHRQLGQDFEKDLFSADFLGYEVFGPSNFVLLPPAVVTALYMFLKNSSVSSFLQVQQHLRWRLESYPFRDSVMIALRLLALRSVEMYASSASSSSSGSTDNGSDPILLEAVTNLVRNLTSPLRFSAFFLEIGRQLEPSCFRFLYPLPDPHVKELTDLISAILDYGCLEVSVAALPLLEDRKHASSLCTFILNHCLKKLTAHKTRKQFPEEEARITPDVFRYGLKLSDPDEDPFDDNSNNDEPLFSSIPAEEMKFHNLQIDYEDDDNDRRRSTGASYFCGLSKFFEPSPPGVEEEAIVDAASSFIEKGFDFELDGEMDKIDDEVDELVKHHIPNGNSVSPSSTLSPRPTAAGVVARHLLEPIFTQGSPDWAEVGRVAELVLGNKGSSLRSCTKEQFLYLMEGTTVAAYESWVTSGSTALTEVDRFLVQNLAKAPNQINTEGAKSAYYLVFVLLAYEDVCEDMLEEVPGLLLLALVVGHTLNAIEGQGPQAQFFLIQRYQKALKVIQNIEKS